MMKSKRNQCTFDNTENQRSQISRSCDKSAQRIDPFLNKRPDEIHQNADADIGDRGNNRHKPGSAKKRKGIWQLNLIEPVVKRRYAESHNNTAEHAHLQRLNSADAGNGTVQNVFCDCSVSQNISLKNKHGIHRYVHYKKRNHCCQRCNFFLLLRHTDRHTYGKDQRQVIENRASGLAHNCEQCVENRSFSQNRLQPVSLNHGCIGKRASHSEQESRYRKDCDRKHKTASNSLQYSENFVFHFFSSFYSHL